jgi:hypothetical protein
MIRVRSSDSCGEVLEFEVSGPVNEMFLVSIGRVTCDRASPNSLNTCSLPDPVIEGSSCSSATTMLAQSIPR